MSDKPPLKREDLLVADQQQSGGDGSSDESDSAEATLEQLKQAANTLVGQHLQAQVLDYADAESQTQLNQQLGQILRQAHELTPGGGLEVDQVIHHLDVKGDPAYSTQVLQTLVNGAGMSPNDVHGLLSDPQATLDELKQAANAVVSQHLQNQVLGVADAESQAQLSQQLGQILLKADNLMSGSDLKAPQVLHALDINGDHAYSAQVLHTLLNGAGLTRDDIDLLLSDPNATLDELKQAANALVGQHLQAQVLDYADAESRAQLNQQLGQILIKFDGLTPGGDLRADQFIHALDVHGDPAYSTQVLQGMLGLPGLSVPGGTGIELDGPSKDGASDLMGDLVGDLDAGKTAFLDLVGGVNQGTTGGEGQAMPSIGDEHVSDGTGGASAGSGVPGWIDDATTASGFGDASSRFGDDTAPWSADDLQNSGTGFTDDLGQTQSEDPMDRSDPGGSSSWEDALDNLSGPVHHSHDEDWPPAPKSSSPAAPPESPSMDSFGSSSSGSGGSGGDGSGTHTPKGDVDTSGKDATYEGGKDISPESVTVDLGGGKTATMYPDGTIVVTFADGTTATVDGGDWEAAQQGSEGANTDDTTVFKDDATKDDATKDDATKDEGTGGKDEGEEEEEEEEEDQEDNEDEDKQDDKGMPNPMDDGSDSAPADVAAGMVEARIWGTINPGNPSDPDAPSGPSGPPQDDDPVRDPPENEDDAPAPLEPVEVRVGGLINPINPSDPDAPGPVSPEPVNPPEPIITDAHGAAEADPIMGSAGVQAMLGVGDATAAEPLSVSARDLGMDGRPLHAASVNGEDAQLTAAPDQSEAALSIAAEQSAEAPPEMPVVAADEQFMATVEMPANLAAMTDEAEVSSAGSPSLTSDGPELGEQSEMEMPGSPPEA